MVGPGPTSASSRSEDRSLRQWNSTKDTSPPRVQRRTVLVIQHMVVENDLGQELVRPVPRRN